MRAVLFFFLIIIAVAAASPYFVGSQIKKEIRKQVAVYDDLPMYTAKVIRYELGYRESHVVVSFGLDDAAFDSIQKDVEGSEADLFEPLRRGMRFPIEIQHGPVLDMHGWGLGWADFSWSYDKHNYPNQADVFEAAGVSTMAVSTARVGFTGEGWSDTQVADIDAIYSAGGTEIQVKLTDFDDDVTFTDFGRKLDAVVRLDSFSIDVVDDESMKIDLEGIEIFSDSDSTGSIQLSTGNTEIAIKGITFDGNGSEGQHFFEIDTARGQVSVSSNDTGDALDIRQSVRFDEGLFDGYRVSDADFAFSYLNISKALYKAYLDSTSLMIESEDSASAAKEFAERMEPLLKSAIQQEPRLELQSIAWTSDAGEIDLSGYVTINPQASSSSFNFDNPFSLIPVLDIELRAKASRGILQEFVENKQKADLKSSQQDVPSDEEIRIRASVQIDNQLGPLLEEGYVQQNGEVYSSVVNLSEGNVIVNGQTIPLPF